MRNVKIDKTALSASNNNAPAKRKINRDYNAPERLQARLAEVVAVAEAKGGKCLSPAYVHVWEKMIFECPKHGTFVAQPRHILDGLWCKTCYFDGLKDAAKNKMLDYIQKRGGKLKSDYINARTHVTVECPFHGDWQVLPVNLLSRNSWCKQCASQKPRPGRRKKSSMRVPILL